MQLGVSNCHPEVSVCRLAGRKVRLASVEKLRCASLCSPWLEKIEQKREKLQPLKIAVK